jgi:hypothetical protein
MIEVRSQPVIEPDPRGGWQLIFWMGEAFDYTTPFRTTLNDMTKALSRKNLCSMQIPEYEADKDFVEGRLEFLMIKCSMFMTSIPWAISPSRPEVVKFCVALRRFFRQA